MRSTSLLPLLAVHALVSSSALAGIVHVDLTATGANNGTSWADAYTDLRPALDAALPGDELWVAQGLYVPGPTAKETDSFFLSSGVALYGGFAGNETLREQRDWVAHPTILSGDVGHDDLPGNIVTANSAHVVTGSGVDATATLDGFIVEAGHTGPTGTPAGAWEMYGGGLFNIAGSPTVLNCTFRRNVCAFAHGGAIYNLDSSPVIRDCRFEHNRAHLGSGAGIFNHGNSLPVIEDCIFLGNEATTGGGGGEAQGAALAFYTTQSATVRRCLFEGNHARQFSPGGGIELARGGAISAFFSTLLVEDCVFRGNLANAGGAVAAWGTTRIVGSTFQGNRAYKTVIQSTSVGGQGGAVVDMTNAAAQVELVACTVVDNEAGEAAVWCSTAADDSVLSGCILWGNTATGAGLSVREAQFKGNAVVTWSCVEGLFQPIPGEPLPTPAMYPGCIELDPQLVSVPGLDLHLMRTSPCIDAGSNALVAGVLTDLDGNRRVHAAKSPVPRVDMGAYEHDSTPPPACPAIHTQPVATTAALGSQASLFVGVDAVGPVTYQWRKGGLRLSDGGGIAGTRTPTLTFDPVATGHAGTYDVVVANACGSLMSAGAYLTVVLASPVTPYCFGDGSGTACPCGNNAPAGDEMGCLNTTGTGATLEAGGLASVSHDTFHLDGADMGTSTCVYLQGESRRNGGLGVVFGDGLLCVGGPIVRLAAKQNSGGTSQFPDTGDPSISERGHVPPGVTRTYQIWYRDKTSTCSGKGYNLTNAVEVTWLP